MAKEKSYKINIDPRILELLGPSLYTNIYYILAELIANAYDANANNVYIIQKDGCIIVEDDGVGMSYAEGDIENYLNVAHETRVNESDVFVAGSEKKRRKMGRKGVGKLAALSVSEDVEIHTIKDGEKSGFVLSRHVADDHKLTPILENDVQFNKIDDSGTSIVMRNPQYTLHKTLKAVRNNLLKIFPLVNKNFKIHLEVNGKSLVIDSFEKEIIEGLGGLIILGEEFAYLRQHFDSGLRDRKEIEHNLLLSLENYTKQISLTNKQGEEQKYDLTIFGWVGVYRTTRNKKDNATDFPDNFISLLSNKKLGEYNILPVVGKNALNEVYIVGQLHIDLFEETTLPDMALSNRQGYKTDDDRYQEVIGYVRSELLPKAVSLRTKYSGYVKDEKDRDRHAKDKNREVMLKEKISNFKDKASSSAASKISKSISQGEASQESIEDTVKQAINVNLPDMGIKRSVDNAKRKLLISHAGKDKAVADFVYDLLLFNGVSAGSIIYTSSDNAASRIPQKTPIFEYLREFFVESYSTEKIYVLYITSDNMAKSWAAVSEVGAGWITKSNHDIFTINNFKPLKPLDVDCEWASVLCKTDAVNLSKIEADKIADKIIYTCNKLDYPSKSKEQLALEISRKANIVD